MYDLYSTRIFYDINSSKIKTEGYGLNVKSIMFIHVKGEYYELTIGLSQDEIIYKKQ